MLTTSWDIQLSGFKAFQAVTDIGALEGIPTRLRAGVSLRSHSHISCSLLLTLIMQLPVSTESGISSFSTRVAS